MTALEEEEPTSIPRVYTVFTFLYKKSIIKRVGIAAIDGSYGLDIFDEDAGVRAGTAEVDDDIVRSPDGFLFEHATRLLAFHNLTYLFDIIHFKGDMSDTSPAMIEIFEDPFTGNNEFDRRTVFTFFSSEWILLLSHL